MKEVCGKALRVTRSHLLSNIQTQVGTRGTKSNTGSHSRHSRVIIPTVVDATGGRREPVTELPVTWKERREYKGKRRGRKRHIPNERLQYFTSREKVFVFRP